MPKFREWSKMGKEKERYKKMEIKKVTLIGTVALLALLFLFFIVTLVSTMKLAGQIKLVTEKPFTVSENINEIKINLAMIRIRTERLQAYNQPSDIEMVRESLENFYDAIDGRLEEIDTLYLGPHEDVVLLRQTYQEIKEEHELFLEFSERLDSTTDDIADYEQKNLYPLYDILEEEANTILDFAHNTQQNTFMSADLISKSTMVWSCIIIAAMAGGLIFFQSLIRRMNHWLYEKNKQFEVLSDTIDETFLIFDRDKDGCDFVSGSANRVLGISNDQLYKNRKLIYQHIKEEEAEKIREEIHFGTDTTWETVVAYQNPAQPQTRWMQLRFYRIVEGQNTKYIMTVTDRTEERRANQALEDALLNAQKANSAKKDFLSRMSHEIRTPLNAIIGMTTIAAASIEDRGRVEDCLEKIGYSSKHLLMLINDVLDMSRIENNRMKVNEEPFELMEFLNAFVSVVYPQARDKGLEFEEKITGFSDHTTYIGDSLRLNQILLNLVSNAIKFTPSGGKVSLEVAHLRSKGTRGWLRFTVSDTGIGMDEIGLERLYKPFEQADASIAGKYGGTGLGMSITQNLVSLLGGHITVKSEPDKGTVFTVELPFEESNIDLRSIKEEVLEELDVLVVDDDQEICEHTAFLLERMKIHAEWVLSGAEAVERVVEKQGSQQEFDVCFIDWKMPNMDGVETTRRIREEVGPDTPIIIISAYDWSDIEDEARKAGVNAFIAKPMFQSSIYNVLVSVTKGAFGTITPKTNEGGMSLEGKRFLLAEDNAVNMKIAVTLLEMKGAEVDGVEDGLKALEWFQRSEPGYYDAVLLDVQMPVMDGCEAARQIRSCGHEKAQTIPILAITANAFAEDVSTVMEAGMNAHVGKPFDIEQLSTVLSRLCNSGTQRKDT